MENKIVTGTVTLGSLEKSLAQMGQTSSTSPKIVDGVTVTAPYVVEPDPSRITAPQLRPQHEYQREIDKLKTEKQVLKDEVVNLQNYIEKNISKRYQIVDKDDILNRYMEIDTTASCMYLVDLVGETVDDFEYLDMPELRSRMKGDSCVCILDKGPDKEKEGVWL